MYSFAAIVLLLVSTQKNQLVEAQGGECNMECNNGGSCGWEEWECSHMLHCVPYFYMVCDCPDGFTGQHCNIPVKTCPDGSQCYHNSECILSTTTTNIGERLYKCDCSSAETDVAVAGLKCEHEATTSCEIGIESSRKAFCTNGGYCREMIEEGSMDDHPGCECLEEYEGPNCQYLVGEAPYHYKYKEKKNETETMTTTNSTGTPVSVRSEVQVSGSPYVVSTEETSSTQTVVGSFIRGESTTEESLSTDVASKKSGGMSTKQIVSLSLGLGGAAIFALFTAEMYTGIIRKAARSTEEVTDDEGDFSARPEGIVA